MGTVMQPSTATAMAYLLWSGTHSSLSYQLHYKLLGTKITIVSFLTVFLAPDLEIGRKKYDKKSISCNCLVNIKKINYINISGSEESRKQTLKILTQHVLCVCVFLKLLLYSRTQHAFTQMWSWQPIFRTGQRLWIWPPSVSSNFYASVNLCLIGMAWPMQNGEPVSNSEM